MAEEGLATQRGAARARVSAKGCIGVKEERRREWEKWRKRKKRGGREREREREKERESRCGMRDTREGGAPLS